MKTILLLVISIMPFNKLRIFLYNSIFRYKISYNSEIGLLNLLDIDTSCIINNAKIGNLNTIKARVFEMHKGAIIGKLNRIMHANKLILHEGSLMRSKNVVTGSFPNVPFDKTVQNLYIGVNSAIINSNSIDISCGFVSIGDNVVTGGIKTQFWTHGYDINRNIIIGNIQLGNNIYVGSSCFFLQGVSIVDNVSIGAGTVVHTSIKESGFYVSSQLVKKRDFINKST